jgi:ubiquinone/menaquinone biosynthesis C-methylase UbiE
MDGHQQVHIEGTDTVNRRAYQRRRLAYSGGLMVVLLLQAVAWGAEDRREWQQPDRVIQDLGLKAEARVADIGCGGGYFSFPLAQAVGPQGKVLAVDVSEKAMSPLRERVERERLTNVEVLVSAPRDTKLTPESVDAALLCLVLHEMPTEDRLPLLQSVVKAIKPGGFLFLIDWRKSREVKQDPYDKLIPRDDLVKLAEDVGLVLDAEFHYLKYQVFLRFRKVTPGARSSEKPVALNVWPVSRPIPMFGGRP